MTNRTCEHCKYISDLKHNFKVHYGHEQSYCCTLFAKARLVVEVKLDDACEEFVQGKDEDDR